MMPFLKESKAALSVVMHTPLPPWGCPPAPPVMNKMVPMIVRRMGRGLDLGCMLDTQRIELAAATDQMFGLYGQALLIL